MTRFATLAQILADLSAAAGRKVESSEFASLSALLAAWERCR